jgi:hypothetical protein
MQSLANDTYEQARQVYELWLGLRAGDKRTGRHTDEEREVAIVSKLIELCTEEIIWALNDDLVGRVFCGIWLIVDYKNCRAGWTGDASVLREGVSRALQAKLNNEESDIVTLIRTSVAQELAECRDERVERLRSQKAQAILPGLLALTCHNQHDNAAIFINHLTNSQRSDLAALLFDRLTDDPAVYIRMDREPQEPERWLLWYIYHSDFATPEKKDKLGGIPKHLIATRRGAIPQNKRGGFVMPLGPMYAKVFDRQKREMNRLRMLPKNPGVKKIAESLDADHSAVSKWLKADLPLTLESDGKGGVYYNFNLKTINRCIELVRGGKRGPKPKNR